MIIVATLTDDHDDEVEAADIKLKFEPSSPGGGGGGFDEKECVEREREQKKRWPMEFDIFGVFNRRI